MTHLTTPTLENLTSLPLLLRPPSATRSGRPVRAPPPTTTTTHTHKRSLHTMSLLLMSQVRGAESCPLLMAAALNR